MIKKYLVLFLIILFLQPINAKKIVIKMATLAPEGTECARCKLPITAGLEIKDPRKREWGTDGPEDIWVCALCGSLSLALEMHDADSMEVFLCGADTVAATELVSAQRYFELQISLENAE